MSDDANGAEAKKALNDWNANVIAEFRANEGRVGGNFEGAPVLLLHTTGKRTGQDRVNPMMYMDLDDTIYVFASAAGAPAHPDWYHNLVANPDVTIEVGTELIAVRAETVDRSERDRIYALQVERFPGFGEYEQKTTRVIPVVKLVRK